MWWFWALLVDKPFSFLSPLGTSPHPASQRSIRQHAPVLTFHVQTKKTWNMRVMRVPWKKNCCRTGDDKNGILPKTQNSNKRNTQEIYKSDRLIHCKTVWCMRHKKNMMRCYSRNQLLISIMTKTYPKLLCMAPALRVWWATWGRWWKIQWTLCWQ